MPRIHPPRTARLAASVLAGGLLLSGCATEQALTKQTQPLNERLTTLERALAESRERVDRLGASQSALESRLTSLETETRDGLRGLDARLAELTERESRADRKLAELSSRAEESARRADDIQTQVDANTAALTTVGERLDASERALSDAARLAYDTSERIDDIQAGLETEFRDRLASTRADAINADERLERAEQRIEQLIADLQAAKTGEQAERARLERELSAAGAAGLTGQAAAAALAERVAQAEQRIKDLSHLVQEAMAMAAKEIFLASGKEAFTVTLTDDKVLYPQNDPNLDPRDRARLDDLAQRLGKLDQEYHLDIQGHTDNTSTDDNNYNLGKARAEVAKRYLHEARGISINRMSTISYGANKPLEGARQNRRIHIRVLVLK